MRLAAGILCAALLTGSAAAQQNNSYWLNYTGSPPYPPGAWTPATPIGPVPMTGITAVLSYSGGAGSLANTGAGDIYCIAGSATKTVAVKAVRISGIASAASVEDVILIKRSSPEVGGTPIAVTATPHDSLNPAATATITAYSASPTPGTTVGAVRGAKIAVATSGNSNQIGDEIFRFTEYYDQPIILHGTSELLCVNVTAFGTGASINVGSEHAEY